MRFTAAIATFLAGHALAGPTLHSAAVRTTASSDQDIIADAIRFAAVQPEASCSIIDCASVIGAAVCIAADISTDDIPGLVDCVSSGASGLCSCAGCVPGLGDFLTNNNICPSS
ncbi:Uu.00g002800.m01.CDS01 [Anthostomella pinea]|uniref:Uu.00g002800.m01.CDS01 n=1 Tax=Anthostomella pinea TaxID=933095 RepID=A0AAI8YIM6_9PEZI|nr:Uu.00g002800.m01.CDS01 [Anthostomella pinea]